MTFDINQVINLLFYVGTLVAIYWKMQRNTDKTLTSHDERLKTVEKEVDKMDGWETKLALSESQLKNLECSIKELTKTMNTLRDEIVEVRIKRPVSRRRAG